MTPRIKFLIAGGLLLLVFGLLIGIAPAVVFGEPMPVCGSAWVRGLGGRLCTDALLMPTVFSFALATTGLAMLIIGMALRQKND